LESLWWKGGLDPSAVQDLAVLTVVRHPRATWSPNASPPAAPTRASSWASPHRTQG